MTAAHSIDLDEFTTLRGMQCAVVRRILRQGEMSSRSVVIIHVARKDSFELVLAQNDHMIWTLASDRTDHALG